MRIFVRYEKGEPLRFLSHLDIQRLLQRAFRRAKAPLAYSQGFNPHPLMSFASALAVGHSSEAEWLDVQLTEAVNPEALVHQVNEALPAGFRLCEAVIAPDNLGALTALTTHFTCRVRVLPEQAGDIPLLRETARRLADGPIVVTKKTKAGIRDVDIRPQLVQWQWEEQGDQAILTITGVHNAMGSLNVELLMKKLLAEAQVQAVFFVHRTGLFFQGTDLLPVWQEG